MKLIKESNEFPLDWSSDTETIYQLQPVGTEVILTTVIDGIRCYCIDTISEISITKKDIFYYFEEADMKVSSNDLLPYTIDNELIIKDLGYQYMRDGYAFDVLYNKDLKEQN